MTKLEEIVVDSKVLVISPHDGRICIDDITAAISFITRSDLPIPPPPPSKAWNRLAEERIGARAAENKAQIDFNADFDEDDYTGEEIQYWDFRASELKQKEPAGKINSKLHSQNCSRRADELQQRLKQRMDTLDKDRVVAAAPPLITSGVLVIPAGLLAQANGSSAACHSDSTRNQGYRLPSLSK